MSSNQFAAAFSGFFANSPLANSQLFRVSTEPVTGRLKRSSEHHPSSSAGAASDNNDNDHGSISGQNNRGDDDHTLAEARAAEVADADLPDLPSDIFFQSSLSELDLEEGSPQVEDIREDLQGRVEEQLEQHTYVNALDDHGHSAKSQLNSAFFHLNIFLKRYCQQKKEPFVRGQHLSLMPEYFSLAHRNSQKKVARSKVKMSAQKRNSQSPEEEEEEDEDENRNKATKR